MSYAQIRYEVADPTATITLHRPGKLNAWTPEMEGEVRDALGRAERDPAVVGIILTGAGRAFCAGADMTLLQALGEGEEMQGMAQEGAPPGDDTYDAGYRRTYSFLASIRKPILSAINGPCVGMAVPIACFTDLRFISDQGYLMTAFSRRGLIAEWGSSWILPRLVGTANAFDLLLSGRKVDAQEALRMGLVNRVVAHDGLLDAARDYVQMLADHCSPASLATMKKQLYSDLLAPVDAALQQANRLMFQTFESHDFKEGVDAFVAKRPPRFERLS